MMLPHHASPSLTVHRPADEVHRRLTSDPQRLVTGATAEALRRCGPLLHRWGLTSTALPTVTAELAGESDIGSLAVRWSGDELETGWPATAGRLLVTPAGTGRCRLTLLTSRDPAIGLAVTQVGQVHGRRATRLALDGFVRAIATLVADLAEATPVPTPAVTPTSTPTSTPTLTPGASS